MTTLKVGIQENISRQIDEQGFALIRDVVSDEECGAILGDLACLSGQSLRRGQIYAARNLLTVPSVADLARSSRIRLLVESILGHGSFPVRGILFDKVSGANWHVGWHQDQIIPVEAQRETPGFTAWSIKEKVPHVRPPVEVLERMLTLRVHLDDCDCQNGALKVIAGSHLRCLLNDLEVQETATRSEPVVCEAWRGSVLAMRPLLLHSSAPAVAPSHRRVIHLEFAADPLPGGLEWPRTD